MQRLCRRWSLASGPRFDSGQTRHDEKRIKLTSWRKASDNCLSSLLSSPFTACTPLIIFTTLFPWLSGEICRHLDIDRTHCAPYMIYSLSGAPYLLGAKACNHPTLKITKRDYRKRFSEKYFKKWLNI